jgi:hypothetical protein
MLNPQPFDAVLGGNNSRLSPYAAVLGGHYKKPCLPITIKYNKRFDINLHCGDDLSQFYYCDWFEKIENM